MGTLWGKHASLVQRLEQAKHQTFSPADTASCLALSLPVSGALEPVEDVGAAGVINLIKRMSIRLLHSHRVTETTGRDSGVTHQI